MSSTYLLFLVFLPVAAFCLMSYLEAKNARSPISFLQYGSGYYAPSYFATLLASNSSLSGALYLIAFYGFLYGSSTFLWVYIFWFSTQLMSYYTVKWVDSIDPLFIKKRGTLHEFLGLIFGNNPMVRTTAAKISLFCYIGLLACEMFIGYEILSTLVPSEIKIGNVSLEPLVVTLSVFGLVTGYCALAGFRGVVKTDELQLALIISMMIAIAIFLKSNVLLIALICLVISGSVSWAYFYYRYKKEPSTAKPQESHSTEIGYTQVFRKLPTQWPAFLTFTVGVLIWLFASRELGFSIELDKVINPVQDTPFKFFLFFALANIVFWLVWWPSAMDQWHRCAATTDSNVSRNKFLGTLGILPVFYLGLLSLTFLFVGSKVQLNNSAAKDPLAGLLELFKGESIIVSHDIWLFIFIAMGLIAAMVSTTDTYLVVAAQTWVSDKRQTRKTGIGLYQYHDQGEEFKRHIMSELRVSVPILFLGAGALALPLLLFLTDVFAAIYFFFSGMLVLAGVLGVAFMIKNKQRRNQMGAAAIFAMNWGIGYVLATNIPIILMLELTLRKIIVGDIWYLQANNWYYAIFINPVIAMFFTSVILLMKSRVEQRGINEQQA